MHKLSGKILAFSSLLLMAAPTVAFQRALQDGDFQAAISTVPIAVVAPASGVSQSQLNTLRKNLPRNVHFASSYPNVTFHSNTDVKRAQEFMAALNDTHVEVIWAIEGRYGAARLLPALQNLHKPDKRKLFIGYSDNTFMHLLFNKWGWQSIHGPAMIETLNPKKDGESFIRMAKVLTGKTPVLQYSGLKPLNQAARVESSIQGEIIGGNLTIVTKSIGTPWQINAYQRILFLEDVFSDGETVDRDLTHLKQAGRLKNVRAVLFGAFMHGDETVTYAIKRFAEETNIPVYQTNLFGHGPQNFPLPFGCKSQIHSLSGKSTYELTIESPKL